MLGFIDGERTGTYGSSRLFLRTVQSDSIAVYSYEYLYIKPQV